MTQMLIGYSDSEDRLWLLLSDDGHQFWLTRRFCANLMLKLEQALTESCPQSGTGKDLAPSVRAALEHQAAHETPDGTPLPPTRPREDLPQERTSLLLSQILMTIDAQYARLELITPQFERLVVLNRAEAHQLLSALWQRCEGAGWGLRAPGLLQLPQEDKLR